MGLSLKLVGSASLSVARIIIALEVGIALDRVQEDEQSLDHFGGVVARRGKRMPVRPWIAERQRQQAEFGAGRGKLGRQPLNIARSLAIQAGKGLERCLGQTRRASDASAARDSQDPRPVRASPGQTRLE